MSEEEKWTLAVIEDDENSPFIEGEESKEMADDLNIRAAPFVPSSQRPSEAHCLDFSKVHCIY